MLRNYVSLGLRQLFKNKSFTFLNIVGLSLGLASFILIFVYVWDELHYDKFNINSGRIYRLNTEMKYGGVISSYAIVAPPWAEALVNNFPEVEKAVRLSPRINVRFKKDDKILPETNVMCADATVFEIFTIPFIAGNEKLALQDANAIVISESMAKKYFKGENALGKTLEIVNDPQPYKVTGIMKDIPSTSHFKADFFLSMNSIPGHGDTDYNHFSFNTYFLLKTGADPIALREKTASFSRKHLGNKMNMDEFERNGNYIKIDFTPLNEIHLRSNRQRELGANGNVEYVRIFSTLAILILILGCINFINLSTARYSTRAKEVGMRKVMGSSRYQLIGQFLSESIIIAFFAAILALLLASMAIPLLEDTSGKHFVIDFSVLKYIVSLLLFIVLVVGIIAGFYPAIFLSSFQPTEVLSGKISIGLKGSALRNGLVIFQFSIAIFLIIGTLVIHEQLHFIRNKDLGYNRKQLLILKNANAASNPEILREEMMKENGVLDASLSAFLPASGARWGNSIWLEQKAGMISEFWSIDQHYLSTMGMSLSKGRNFSKDRASDSSAMIINEAAEKMLGINIDPLEKIIQAGDASHTRSFRVIGVVRDFNFNSLRDNVSPLVMIMESDWRASLTLKIKTNDLARLMKRVQQRWDQFAPGEKLEFSFMDDDFDAVYKSEQQVGKIFNVFTGLAILIAILGLFGLSAYAAERRNKEIGIRIILGAGISSIVMMLNKDYVKLVMVSIIVATPLAGWCMSVWLEGYAYRISLGIWLFIAAAGGALIIAFVAVSYNSLKAATSDPVKTLRSE